MHDIRNREDIKFLVDKFYEKVNKDNLLSPIFNEISKVNWDLHLPIMYDFWGNILLGGSEYKGEPLQKHFNLPIGIKHFEKWLELFFQTLNENFSGEITDEAHASAIRIGDLFMVRMGLKKFSIETISEIKKNNSRIK